MPLLPFVQVCQSDNTALYTVYINSYQLLASITQGCFSMMLYHALPSQYNAAITMKLSLYVPVLLKLISFFPLKVVKLAHVVTSIKQSPVFKGHFLLFCHRKFHMNRTSFKRLPVLWDHFFFVPKVTLYRFDCTSIFIIILK